MSHQNKYIMKRVSATEFKNSIKKHFCKESKMTIPQAKEAIRKQIVSDEYDTDISAGGVRLFYTDNTNYMQGGQ